MTPITFRLSIGGKSGYSFERNQFVRGAMLLTAKQLRAHLQVSKPTFQKMIRQGLPRIPLANRVFRYDVAEVEGWLKRRGAAEPAPAVEGVNAD